MNLSKKKSLAQRVLNVGRKRIVFLKSRLDETKEAITKQDIRELHKEGAIIVKDAQGRKKNQPRKRKRGAGKIKKKVNKRKQEYVKMTRKLRACLKDAEGKGSVSKEEKKEIRNLIRNRHFKSKRSLKNYIEKLEK